MLVGDGAMGRVNGFVENEGQKSLWSGDREHRQWLQTKVYESFKYWTLRVQISDPARSKQPCFNCFDAADKFR